MYNKYVFAYIDYDLRRRQDCLSRFLSATKCQYIRVFLLFQIFQYNKTPSSA